MCWGDKTRQLCSGIFRYLMPHERQSRAARRFNWFVYCSLSSLLCLFEVFTTLDEFLGLHLISLATITRSSPSHSTRVLFSISIKKKVRNKNCFFSEQCQGNKRRARTHENGQNSWSSKKRLRNSARILFIDIIDTLRASHVCKKSDFSAALPPWEQ